MSHKFSAGQQVYFSSGFSKSSSQSVYKILSVLPIENDDRRRYRIKSATEAHERIAEENQLTVE
ncbi:MAG: hypothetical protein WA792_03095 [Pseudolabrys sp.]